MDGVDVFVGQQVPVVAGGSLDAKGVPASMDGGVSGTCKVGFWNVSGRDVKVTVAGKTYAVPRDRTVTVTVNRSFVWAIDSQQEQAERVPDEQTSHEIVIR